MFVTPVHRNRLLLLLLLPSAAAPQEEDNRGHPTHHNLHHHHNFTPSPHHHWTPIASHHYVFVPLDTTRKNGELAVRQSNFITTTSSPSSYLFPPCDGMTNAVHDLTVISLFTGVIGTVLSIFTASYTSVLSNSISALSAIFSLLLGIPSAVLTYLAASDRLSYTAANLLSLLSFANTAFGALSVDFGNKDIFTSQLANVIGVFSLTLSFITAFPEALLPPAISAVASFLRTHPEPLRRYVMNYGCYGSPTFYDLVDNYLRNKYGNAINKRIF